MATARDLFLARRAKKAGAKQALIIITEARKARIPISWGFALIEQESAFRNIFGCDIGPRSGPPYCHQKATKSRVDALIRHVRAGGVSNGVGYGQLTSLPYVLRAHRLRAGIYKGAHRARPNIRVSFQVLREKTGGDMSQAWRYNGARAYQAQIAAKQRRWHEALT